MIVKIDKIIIIIITFLNEDPQVKEMFYFLDYFNIQYLALEINQVPTS